MRSSRLLTSGIVGTAIGLLVSGALARSEEPPSQPSGNSIDYSALDRSVDACDNFYRHACGSFIKRAQPDRAHPVVSLTQQKFDANLDAGLKRIFAEDASGDPELARLKTFYQSCLGEDRTGAATVRQWLGRIDHAATRPEIQKLIRDLAAIGVDPFFTYGGRPDRTDWTRYRGEIHNPLLWADPKIVEATFVAAGLSPAEAAGQAKAAAGIVSALRQHRGQRWDASTAENPRTLKQLEALAPAIQWRRYFALVGAPPGRPVNVTSPAYLKDVETVLTERSLADIRAFLRWQFLFSLRGELPQPYNRAFGDLPPNFRVPVGDANARCRDATVRAMGVEFSRQYAHRILGWRAREVATQLAESIKQTIVASIAADDWLSPEARRATVDKLQKTDLKIGFPDRWPAVGHYPIRRDRFFENVLSARAFEQKREWSRAGQPRNRQDWEMKVDPWVGEGMAAARLVVPNGYPDAFTNSLIMTAAFLAPPRLDPDAAPELNYASFGTVFAHEFVHVAQLHMFDATGRDGELWSKQDQKAADERGACVIAEANAFHPLPGLKMDGADQFDENVADFGGVRLAYEALAHKLGPQIQQRDASGTSPAQRFFYRFAQSYCTAQTDESLRQSVAVDGHAPPEFRVNGTLSNLAAFREAFACAAGSRMTRPAGRECRVW